MIIACPQCTHPFELRDTDVAELVQLDCPQCRFRMILDFAAANDPRLVEAGMQMASGYRTTADYRRATQPGPRPILVDAPSRTPVEPVPEVAVARVPDEPVRVVPDAGPIAAEAPRAPEPSVAADAQVDRTMVATPASRDADFDGDLPTRVALPRQATQIGMVPPAVPVPVADTGRAASGPHAESPAPPAAPRPATASPATPAASPATPAASPEERRAAAATTRPLPDAEVRPAPPSRRPEPVAAASATADDELETPRRTGAVGTFFLVLLLVLAAGLTLASLMRKNTVDPRPLLEDLYRQYIGR